jgi:hypothetical protein
VKFWKFLQFFEATKTFDFVAFLFAQRSGQTRPAERSRSRPDQGEDNLNRKGAAGNGRV